MVLHDSGWDLIEACQRGDRESFRALFEAHKDKVYSIAYRYSGNEAVAMDIAQETFLKLFTTIRDFRGNASFESWLYRVVVNCCLDHKRRGRRLTPLVDDFLEVLRVSGESVLQKLLRAEVSERVQAAVSRLAPEQRIVIVLRYTRGLSYDEIAEVLGCSMGTVASRLNRAHKILERRLAHLAPVQGGASGQKV